MTVFKLPVYSIAAQIKGTCEKGKEIQQSDSDNETARSQKYIVLGLL
jgi:hypothetical protein